MNEENKNFRIYNINKIYQNFNYSQGYKEMVELGLIDFGIWNFIPDERIEGMIFGLKKLYPQRNLIPFAENNYNDDIACFDAYSGEKVLIIHTYASPGFEQRKEYENIWYWLSDVIKELVDEKTGYMNYSRKVEKE